MQVTQSRSTLSFNMSQHQNYCHDVSSSNLDHTGLKMLYQRINRDAMVCSTISLLQFVLHLLIYVLYCFLWLGNSFEVIMSVANLPKFVLVLPLIVFIQKQLCINYFMYVPSFSATRFQKLRHMFCIKNLKLLVCHIITGGSIFWLYSSDGSKIYLLVGILNGVYTFAKNYFCISQGLEFPLIQQNIVYRVKAALLHNIIGLSAIWNSCQRFFPVVPFYYSITHYTFVESTFNLFSLWLCTILYVITMKVMKLLLNVHLTEHYEFPVSTNMSEKETEGTTTLIEALKRLKVPIVHKLAYLDLCSLAKTSVERRQQVFTLSYPGGHPHTWNNIFKVTTALIENFTNDLNNALHQASSTNLKESSKSESNPSTIPQFHFHSHWPSSDLRKLASPSRPIQTFEVGVNFVRPIEYQSFVEIASNNIQMRLNSLFAELNKNRYISYLFVETPDSRVNYLLHQSQPIAWAVEGLSFLSAASLTEDRYGIVLKDLKDIISTILNLKQVLDKLFKQSLIVKKSFANDSLEVQMKYLLKSSVKRSLYKIAVTFGPYIKDLRLPVDLELQMNNYLTFREV